MKVVSRIWISLEPRAFTQPVILQAQVKEKFRISIQNVCDWSLVGNGNMTGLEIKRHIFEKSKAHFMLVLSIIPFNKLLIHWQLSGSLEFSKTDQWLDLEVNAMSFIVADRPQAMHVKRDTSWVSYD